MRIKESDNYVGASLQSDSFTVFLEGSVAITGTARYGQTLTANVTGAQSDAVVFNYVWKAGESTIKTTSINALTLDIDNLAEGYRQL
ncbi:MAG: hypothetical protein ACOX66_02725 [Oscillospiraceae bacterium]